MIVKFNRTKYEVPTGYATMTWAQYLVIQNSLDDIDIVAAFLGIPYDVVRKSEDREGFYYILECLKFLKSEPKVDKTPSLITPHNRVYALPSTFSEVELGQYEDMKQILLNEDLATFEKVEKVVVCGCMKAIMGSYDTNQTEMTTKMVGQCTVESVISSYSFFLRSFNGSRHGTWRTWPLWVTGLTKLWQDLKIWIGSASSISSPK